MSAVSRLKIEVEDSECHLWKDEQDGHYYVEICLFDVIQNPKDIKRLILFLEKCHKKMCAKTA